MFKKATKLQAKLRLALCGIAGSGKTYSSLAIASELSKLGAGRVALLDSERGSASLYADLFDFDVCELDSFSPLTYVESIKAAEGAGYGVIVIDSLSHAWAGKDGALEKKDEVAARDPKNNSYTAWRHVTPMQNEMVDSIVGSKCHVIATMRQKSEYVQDKDERGKTEIRKVGLGVVQRDQIEFEFTMVGELDQHHLMRITKTRIHGIDVGDIFEKPGASFSQKVWKWLQSGAEAPAPSPAPPAAKSEERDKHDEIGMILANIMAAATQRELDKAVVAGRNFKKGSTEYERIAGAYISRKKSLTASSAR